MILIGFPLFANDISVDLLFWVYYNDEKKLLKFQQGGETMETYFEVLKKCPLFRGIEKEQIVAMLGCLGARTVPYQKQETILAEGERARYIGIVLSGSAQILQVDFFGNRNIMATVEPGELFGESFACAGVEALPVAVVANEETVVLFIDCFRITQTCSSSCGFHQQMIYNLMKVVATKNMMFHQKIEITSKRSTREKLMAYLLLQAKRHNSNSFEIPYDRQELADYLGVDRSGLSTEIGKMKKEGLIDCKKNCFTLIQS